MAYTEKYILHGIYREIYSPWHIQRNIFYMTYTEKYILHDIYTIQRIIYYLGCGATATKLPPPQAVPEGRQEREEQTHTGVCVYVCMFL